MMRVGEMLTPIVRAMGQELLAGNYIKADETPVAVQMHDGRGKNHQAYLWQYGRPGGSTDRVYDPGVDVTLYEIRRLASRCPSRESLLLVHFSIALKEEIIAL